MAKTTRGRSRSRARTRGQRLRGWLSAKVVALAITVVGSGSIALLKFVYLPWAASAAVETLAEGYGLRLDVESWTADLLTLTLSAQGVQVSIDPGRYSRPEVFRADSVDLDLSAARYLRTGSIASSIHEVVAREVDLHLERRLDGAWNWRGLADPELLGEVLRDQLDAEPMVGGLALRKEASAFQIARLRVEGGRISLTEEVSSPATAGMATESFATLNVDDLQLAVFGVRGWVDRRARATRFELEGRVANGKIQANGSGNLFAWAAAPAGARPDVAGGLATAPASPAVPLSWAPSLLVDLAIERVESGVLARFVPDAALQPVRGNVSGAVRIDLEGDAVRADARLQLDRVAFQVAPGARALLGQADRVEAGLKGFLGDGAVLVSTQGKLDDPSYGLVASLQKEAVRASTTSADPVVRDVAARDVRFQEVLARGGQELLQTQIKSELESLVNKGLGKATGDALAEKVGAKAVQAIQGVIDPGVAKTPPAGAQAQSAKPERVSPNVLERGAIGVWRGVRGLFGGGRGGSEEPAKPAAESAEEPAPAP